MKSPMYTRLAQTASAVDAVGIDIEGGLTTAHPVAQPETEPSDEEFFNAFHPSAVSAIIVIYIVITAAHGLNSPSIFLAMAGLLAHLFVVCCTMQSKVNPRDSSRRYWTRIFQAAALVLHAAALYHHQHKTGAAGHGV